MTSLPPAPPDETLENVVPPKHVAWLSSAGRWAMRPETAMATVFLVMAGSSALLVRGRGRHSPNASVVITQQGEPIPAPAPSALPAARGRSEGDLDGGVRSSDLQRDYTVAQAAFASGRYDEARWRFDVLAARDPRGVLGTARVIRQQSGCAAAIASFAQAEVAGRGASVEWDARLEIATCFRKLGDSESAIRELTPLLTLPTFRDRARAELESLAAQARTKPPSPSR